MKKITRVLLALTFVLCLCACSNKTEKNQLATLREEGYDFVMTSMNGEDKKWKSLLQKGEDVTDSYKVVINLDQNTYDKLSEMDIFDQEDEYFAILETIPECEVTSMKDELPSENEFSEYIGKTIGDFENAGYERSGYIYDEEGCIFYADGPKYSVHVQTNEVITFETMDDYSENDIRELTIKSIEFEGFSFSLLD